MATTPQPNSQHTIQHILPGHQQPPLHQRARCLKFSPSLPTIEINNRRNAEEAYYVGEECPLIELPSHGWGQWRGGEDEVISRFTNKIAEAFEC